MNVCVLHMFVEHVVSNKVEAAYLRSDLFERRRPAHERLGRLPRWREPLAARTMIPRSTTLPHQVQRPRNVSASVL